MNDFIRKALSKVSKLSSEQQVELINQIYKQIEIYDGIFSSINEGILVLDKKNNIIYLNRMLLQILQLDTKIKLSTLSDFQIPLFTKLIEEFAKDEDKIIGFEIDLSSEIYIKISFLPYVKNRKLEGNIILIEDIIEKKKEEELLKRAEALTSFTIHARNIAHEIKNPLGAIDINLQLLKKEIEKQEIVTRKMENYFKVIKEEINRLDRTVTDFLLTVRPIKINLKRKNISEIIKSVYNLLNPELSKNNIKFILNLNKVSDILIDEKLLRQVLINLIKNSEDSLLDTIKKNKKIEILVYETESKMHINIKDNGVGIKNEIKDEIFKPQFTTKEKGSGIGLTLSYKIIKEHGGEIFVNSKENKGSVFSITLPKIKRDNILIEGY